MSVAVCPNKHALKLFETPHDRFSCDLCGADQPTGAAMRGCQLCEYDVCAQCKAGEALSQVEVKDVAAGEVCPTSGHAPSSVPAAPSVEVVERIETIRKPASDTRLYRYVRLSNQLQVVLVSDPDADKAAASMDVSVGHACDPPELPGLAHFLEHMLFLGTAKYPDEAEYQAFLAQNGGGSNAYTAMENTNYHFDVLPAHLAGALDRFAQFFLAPLFTEGATGRELNAIDSENAKNLQSDQWRMAQLTRWMASPEHPQHKFGTGNSSTLVDLPARPVSLRLAPAAGGRVALTVAAVCAPPLRVRDALIAFHARHYSANAMRLCVLGRQSLDELEALVLPLFGSIPNTDRPSPSWGGHPYEHSTRRALVSVPVRQLRLLTVLWPMPPIKSLWRSKPYRYISHLLGHESEGSLLSLLKAKGWVDSLCAGESASASDFSLFELQMALTEEGDNKVGEILRLAFACLNMLRASPPSEWVFEESRSLAEMGFLYKEQDEPMDAANSIATLLEHHPPSEVLAAPHLHEEFDPAAITSMLGLLVPERVMTLHTSAAHAAAATPFREPWYGTRFGSSYIDDATIAAWAGATEDTGALRLPDPNPFIPTDFSLECERAEAAGVPLPRLPTRLRNSAGLELWHKTDATFRKPKVNLCLAISTAEAYRNPLAVVMTSLFTRQLSDELTEFSYHAEVASCHYRVQSTNSGLALMFGGYSHKLPALLHRVASKFARPDLMADRFAIHRDIMRRTYANFFKEQPYQHATYMANVLLEHKRHHILEYLQVVSGDTLTLEGYRHFCMSVLPARVRVQALCHGNATASQAEEMVATACTALGSEPLAASERDEVDSLLRALRLPEGTEIWVRQHGSLLHELQREHANTDDTNSAIELLLQVGVDERPRTLLVEMLEQVLHKSVEQQLRTVEQLGYIVWCTVRFTYNTVGLRFIIQSSVASPATLDERIEAFLDTVPTILRDLTEDEFRDYRQSLVERKLEVDKKLRQETGRYWHEITPLGQYDFDRHVKDAEVVGQITQEQLRTFWDENCARQSPRRRKASFQVFSSQHELPPAPEGVVALDTLEQLVEYKKTLDVWPAVSEAGGGTK